MHKNLDAPVNRIVSHAAAYVLFVVLIIISLENPLDTEGILDFNWSYNFPSLMTAVGFIMRDIEDMHQLALSTSTDETDKIGFVRKTMKRCWGFFGDNYTNFRFLGHSVYLLGVLVQGLGYLFDPMYVNCQNTAAGYNVTNEKRKKCEVLDDDASSYGGFHTVKVGICLQGMAILIVMTHLLQFLRSHPAISALYLGGVKCASNVISFFVTYGFITLNFTLALYFVLRQSMVISEACTDEEIATFTSTFTSPFNTFKLLVLSFFGPGYPHTIDACTSGISNVVGLLLWFSYYIIMIVVLLNLLIALMNVKTSSDLENGIDTWKFHRTQLWMRFCKKNIILPPPMNIVDILITLPLHCARFVRYTVEKKSTKLFCKTILISAKNI